VEQHSKILTVMQITVTMAVEFRPTTAPHMVMDSMLRVEEFMQCNGSPPASTSGSSLEMQFPQTSLPNDPLLATGASHLSPSMAALAATSTVISPTRT